MTSVCSSSSISGCRRTTWARQPISAAPVRSPPAWMIRARVCAASSPKPEPPVGAAIEAGAQGEQLVNPVRAFTCEDSDGFGVGQAVAGGQGVGRVLAGAVAGAERHRDAALRPGAGAVGERFLGDHDAACPSEASRQAVQRPAMPVPTITGRVVMAEIYGGAAVARTEKRRDPRPSVTVGSRPPSVTSSPAPAAPAPPARNTMFGSQAASVGSISPPAPTAFMIWVRSRKITVVPRLIAMPTAAPARGAWYRERRAEQGDDEAGGRHRQLERLLHDQLVGVVPRALQGVDVAAQLRVAHLVRRLRLGQQVGRRLGRAPGAACVRNANIACLLGPGDDPAGAVPASASAGSCRSSSRCRP